MYDLMPAGRSAQMKTLLERAPRGKYADGMLEKIKGFTKITRKINWKVSIRFYFKDFPYVHRHKKIILIKYDLYLRRGESLLWFASFLREGQFSKGLSRKMLCSTCTSVAYLNEEIMKKERMMKMKKLALTFAMMTAAMVMGGFSALAEGTETETMTETAVDWENGETIQAIRDKGVITVATGTYVPFEFRDEDNNIVGFDIDFAQYIADKLGVELEVTDMEFQSIIPSIQNGEYDFSIAAMYKTEERCEAVDMSKSYCDSGMILAVKEGTEYETSVTSLADCDGLKVAVKEGATSCKVAESFLEENPDVSYEIVQYKDTVGCVSDLLAGRVEVVVNDLLNQKELSKEYEGTVIVCEPFTHAENAIAVQKGKEDLLAFINSCIDDYYEDGTYDALWEKWIEGSTEE